MTRRAALLIATITTPLLLLVLELSFVVTGQPTISHAVQVWSQSNYQIVGLLCAAAGISFGWLLAHFTQPPS